jgi:hypothetical protein
MPRRRAHAAVGALCGFILSLYIQPQGVHPLAALFFALLLGLVGGLLPDRLEPPIHPGHRDAFHFIFGPIAFILFYWLWSARLLLNFQPFLVAAFALGYASHFFLDLLPSY